VTVTPATLREWALPEPGSDKESRGRVLVVGGSATTPGAVRLAGEAAARAGAGKLRLATVSDCVPSLAVAVPEAAVYALPTDAGGRLDVSAADQLHDLAAEVDAVLIGPGLKAPEAVVALLERLLPRLRTRVVLDAVATAYVTTHPDDVPPDSVLTVNPDELESIGLGTPEEASARTGAVVLCGGVEKQVAAPDGRTWVVQGGGPGLGSSGSGDVQAGIVAGLLARGAEPAQAAVWGAFLHARAGEELAGAVGRLGFLARELPPVVPQLLEQLS
jgi:hydroxyethylthiazole kinase-like uncharacterized protein yjeF